VARALITGCSTGIGRATAVELTKRGHDVVATARRPEVLDDLDVVQRLALDVMSDASVAAAVEQAGDIDILVNNAGISVGGPVERVAVGDAQRMFETNVWGAVRMVQALAPGMRARSHGWIVNVTSTMGRVVAPLGGYYAASKWALEALSEAMDNELRHFGIRTIVIEPGYIDTPILESERVAVDPPYDELERLWEAAVTQLQGDGGPPGPEIVAVAIADILEQDEPKLRHPVGADAEMIISLRDSMSYEEFVTTVRGTLGIDAW
jgi:NAD(P)-dependent dehydrogenase (short-subunit alcohol dehydrogenase family)